jgi:hypothetical protein
VMVVGSLNRVIKCGARWRSARVNKSVPRKSFLIQTGCGETLGTLALGPGKGRMISIVSTGGERN